jgi:predicted  nucleic acid-binding Zn-ribbon protein
MTQQQSPEGRHELRESMRSSSQLITQSLIAAQQRNLQFTQHTVEEAVEVLKSHAEAMSSLLEQLEQQETAQKLEQGTVEWVRRALSSYEQALDGAGQRMRQGLQNVENALANLQTTTKKTHGDVKKINQPT